jgi:hypothetical protein
MSYRERDGLDNSRVPLLSEVDDTGHEQTPYDDIDAHDGQGDDRARMNELATWDSAVSTGKDGAKTQEVATDGGAAHASRARAGTDAEEGLVREAEEEVVQGEELQAAASGRKRWSRPGGRKSKSYSHTHFRVYKRRWFGLCQLVLLNIVVSWDVSTLAGALILMADGR